jgi:hypothetical protein
MKKLLRKIRKRINAYVERLAESNRKYYGDKRLDCCDMNNKQNNIIHRHTKEG